jgi:hypothetical protein
MVNQFHDLGHRGLKVESTLGEIPHLDLFKIGKRRDKKDRKGINLALQNPRFEMDHIRLREVRTPNQVLLHSILALHEHFIVFLITIVFYFTATKPDCLRIIRHRWIGDYVAKPKI